MVVARAVLDFCYYAQLRMHTNESLDALDNALTVFHAHKDILTDLEVCEHFNIPKLHQLSHYIHSIKLFGAADGFNTELPERLHIDFAKEAYRASNKCDYKEQMAMWLQRQESIFWRTSYFEWLTAHQNSSCNTGQTVRGEDVYDSDSDTDDEALETHVTSPHPNPSLPIITKQLQMHHILAKVGYSHNSLDHMIKP
jgi:hypothetical protein